MPSTVSYQHDDYRRALPLWTLVRDAVEGSRAIKAKGVTYLPQPNASDESEENQVRYAQYKQRAVWSPVTGRTLTGLLGQVYNLPPRIELPPQLESMIKNVDGGGVTLVQQSRQVLRDVLSISRAGLLVDFPVTQGPATIKEQAELGLYPVIKFYPAESVINWGTTMIGSERKLNLIVLLENRVDPSDSFEIVHEPVYRVLRLVDGVYQVEIWSLNETTGQYTQEPEIIRPLNADGERLREIPFTFVGASDNDIGVDEPLLYDLANLNIAQYRNSADYEEACYICGQPTPYFTGLTQTWVETVLKGTIALGSRAAVLLPEGGSAGLLQVQPNTMPKEAMEMKQNQMIALGARLIDKAMVRKTATEVELNHISETTLLGEASRNVSSAYTRCLAWALNFIQVTEEPEIVFELNTAYDLLQLDSQDRIALVNEWMSGLLTFEEVRHVLRRGGVARVPTKDAIAQIKNEASLRPAAQKKEQKREESNT